MLKYFSADWIFPVNKPPMQNAVIAFKANGEIDAVLTENAAQNLNVEIVKYEGAIVPGFVNTHCHLELSHMLGQIPMETGLVEFVQSVIKSRQADAEKISLAMQNADKQMFDNGIVAVGDISNQLVSKEIKQNSRIYYHTFVEAMGLIRKGQIP